MKQIKKVTLEMILAILTLQVVSKTPICSANHMTMQCSVQKIKAYSFKYKCIYKKITLNTIKVSRAFIFICILHKFSTYIAT